MNLENVYFVGQTVADIVITGTLLAILIQTRQANRIARLDMTMRIGESFAENMRQMAANADFAAAFRKVMFEGGHVDRVSLTRTLLYFNLAAQANVNAFYAAREGLINEQFARQLDLNLCWYLTRPVFAAEWRRLRSLYPPDFLAHMEACLAENGGMLQELSSGARAEKIADAPSH